MTERWRATLRLALFVIAVVAIVGIFGAGMRAMLQRSASAGPAGTAETETPEVAGRAQAPKSLTNTLLGIYLSFRQADIEQPVNPEDTTKVAFSIQPGETASMIGPRLEQMGLIRDAGLFNLVVRYRGVDNALEVGDYQLSPSMTLDQIVTELQHGRSKGVLVTIPEGWRMEQVAAKLEEAGLGKSEDYLALMRKNDYPYDWFQERPQGAPDGLEGFLFPDTYEFPADATPAAVIDTMLRNFDRKVTPGLRRSMASHGLSFYQAMVLASIVEREAVVATERPTIAAVFMARLDRGMYLQADPTVSYAKGFDPQTKRWWRPMLEGESQSVDSPYNTFLHGGLTPGPICSPGLSSVEGVAQPDSTPYLYFVAKGDGSHVFAETFEEHLANVRKYGQ
ncbi:MAG TPA: endolytic transglycosylase MltG [Anaerolineae bacterium]|nr:endolytic transglycosylase MltG [Anaerolineae bacterium]HOQ98767.1 endolytic transglycosylase MltG [Anaerolineae bacterium]